MSNNVRKKWSKHKIFVDLLGFFDKCICRVKGILRRRSIAQSDLNHKREEI